jgi:hypothetical protein
MGKSKIKNTRSFQPQSTQLYAQLPCLGAKIPTCPENV